MRVFRDRFDNICVELEAGETFGNFTGPCQFVPGMEPGNAEYDALMALVDAEVITIASFQTLDPEFDLGQSIAQAIGD
jgi:hypothetical protein